MKTWRALGYVAALAGALTTLSASAAETLKIGLSLSITGPASSLGDPEKKVIELYADNHRPGLACAALPRDVTSEC